MESASRWIRSADLLVDDAAARPELGLFQAGVGLGMSQAGPVPCRSPFRAARDSSAHDLSRWLTSIIEEEWFSFKRFFPTMFGGYGHANLSTAARIRALPCAGVELDGGYSRPTPLLIHSIDTLRESNICSIMDLCPRSISPGIPLVSFGGFCLASPADISVVGAKRRRRPGPARRSHGFVERAAPPSGRCSVGPAVGCGAGEVRRSHH